MDTKEVERLLNDKDVLGYYLAEFFTVPIEVINSESYTVPNHFHAQCGCDGCVFWLYDKEQALFKRLVLNQRPFDKDSILLDNIFKIVVTVDSMSGNLDYNCPKCKYFKFHRTEQFYTDGTVTVGNIFGIRKYFTNIRKNNKRLFVFGTGNSCEITAYCKGKTLFIRMFTPSDVKLDHRHKTDLSWGTV